MHSETDASLASSWNCRHWVSEVVRQRIPGHRTGDGKPPTAERAATISWYDEMVAAGRWKSLTTGNVRCGVAAVHEVLGSLALETPVNCHSELMEDPLRNIETVQLGVEQMVSSLGWTSQSYWRHGLRHSANVVACQWRFLATQPTWYCNRQCAMWWRHARVFADSASSDRRILRIWRSQ